MLGPRLGAGGTNQFYAALEAGWLFAPWWLYLALVFSVFAHSVYYALIQRYEANLVAPLNVMSPLRPSA